MSARAGRATARHPVLRIAVIAIVVVLAIATIRMIVRHKLSEAFFEDASIPTAFAVNPSDGITAGYLAWTLQRSGQGRIAVPIARHAFAETPLSAAALGTLALADPQRGAGLIDFAAGAGWRDLSIQTWLGRIALDRGDAVAAATHIDAAARIQGPEGEVRTLIDRMAATPATRSAIAARLLLGPTWRFAYFAGTTHPLGSIAARTAILETLAGTTAPPTALEITAITALSSYEYGLVEAYDVWRRLARPRIVGFVYDPDFAAASDDPDNPNPYLWRITAAQGVTTEVVPDGGHSTLHVTADGLSTGSVVAQMVRITPGRHRLLVAGRYGSTSAASAFRWSLSCWDAHKATALVQPVSGQATGNAGFDFDVPADGSCPMLRIELSVQSASIPGQVDAWFSGVRVE